MELRKHIYLLDLSNLIELYIAISSDGDFYSLVKYLDEKEKLEAVLASELKSCSWLLREAAKSKVQFVDDLRLKLEYK